MTVADERRCVLTAGQRGMDGGRTPGQSWYRGTGRGGYVQSDKVDKSNKK